MSMRDIDEDDQGLLLAASRKEQTVLWTASPELDTGRSAVHPRFGSGLVQFSHVHLFLSLAGLMM